MSLFPAYSEDTSKIDSDGQALFTDVVLSPDILLASENQLLASDPEDERRPRAPPAPAPHAPPAPPAPPAAARTDDFYLDSKYDVGNLRVSTLYYPGRPEYRWSAEGLPGGRGVGPARGGRRGRRYFRAPPPPPLPAPAAGLAERVAALQRALLDSPLDAALWLRLVDLQELYGSPGAALSAAEAAGARLPRCPLVRGARLRAARAALPRAEYAALLQRELAGERSPAARCSLWELAVRAAGEAGDGAAGVGAVAAAALRDMRGYPYPAAYPRLLYAYGSFLRAAGLWEQLVLLVELLAAMNYPAGAFPPAPESSAATAAAEAALEAREEALLASGLPLSAVWGRVERARAAAHWRPARAAPPADPQRCPLPADVADLLLPIVDPDVAFHMTVQFLRLAKVPVFPCAGYAARAAAGAGAAWGWARGAGAAPGGEALLPLVRAARRLPPAHPARAPPAAARRLVGTALDPPHYFSDAHGYLRWVTALWEAAAAWAGAPGEPRRVALLCWRLRWLHALLLLVDGRDEEGRLEAQRIRREAREALRAHAGDSPLPYAQHARLERAAGAAGEGGERAARVALRVMRAQLQRRDAPAAHALYLARVVGEVVSPEAGLWATASAALRLELPPDPLLAAAPPARLLRDALHQCEERCAELEAQHDAEPDGAEESEPPLVEALLPGDAEWGAARVRLAAPPRRRALLRALLAGAGTGGGGERGARYREQAGAALAAAAGGRAAAVARALAPLFPDNALLALMCGGAPLWAWHEAQGPEARLRVLRAAPAPAAPAGTDVGALGAALPPLLRAAAADWEPGEAQRAARACRRLTAAGAAGAGGCAWTLRLEAEARAARPRLRAALYDALDDAPDHKWVYVRGAAWCPAEAAPLADLLLERQLRVHALLDELEPLAAPVSEPITEPPSEPLATDTT